MAEFLTTAGVSHRLEEIINAAAERLVIISPYLRVNTRIKELLEDKDRLRRDVWVIYGKNELRPEENNWLSKLTSIKTGFLQNLHAKCYMNENEALVTSMNLYEFSQVNNREMGIVVSRDEDPEIYDAIREESDRIVRASEIIQITVDKVEAAELGKENAGSRKTPRKSSPTVTVPQKGFCIRCKADLPANPKRPYCITCYTSWSQFKNGDYEEKYCHICKSEHKSTFLKPACPACYRKYRDVFEFAAN